jgi:hypothetical protein
MQVMEWRIGAEEFTGSSCGRIFVVSRLDDFKWKIGYPPKINVGFDGDPFRSEGSTPPVQHVLFNVA